MSSLWKIRPASWRRWDLSAVLKDGESKGEGGVLPSSYSQGCEGRKFSHTWASHGTPPSEGLSLPASPAPILPILQDLFCTFL